MMAQSFIGRLFKTPLAKPDVEEVQGLGFGLDVGFSTLYLILSSVEHIPCSFKCLLFQTLYAFVAI
jgi:hypothetical protein